MREGKLSRILRPCAVVGGILLICVSIYWSERGFSFDMARSGTPNSPGVTTIGLILAIICTLNQFIFATNVKELNMTLTFFGLVSYAYSIYSNYLGIIQYQGLDPNRLFAFLLAVMMDGLAEPMIAWGLYESLEGDFLGNLSAIVSNSFKKFFNAAPMKRGDRPKPPAPQRPPVPQNPFQRPGGQDSVF